MAENAAELKTKDNRSKSWSIDPRDQKTPPNDLYFQESPPESALYMLTLQNPAILT
jgi:hypothetical protein